MEGKKIALYFGSFNPLHEAHKAVVLYLAKGKIHDISETWMVVTPENPLVSKESIFSGKERIQLLQKIFEDLPNVTISDVEFYLERPLFTYKSLRFIREEYPSTTFSFVMGSDLIFQLEQWQEVGEILQNHELLVFKRPGYVDGLEEKVDQLVHKYAARGISVVDGPWMDLSSTEVRILAKRKEDLVGKVPPTIADAIKNKWNTDGV